MEMFSQPFLARAARRLAIFKAGGGTPVPRNLDQEVRFSPFKIGIVAISLSKFDEPVPANDYATDDEMPRYVNNKMAPRRMLTDNGVMYGGAAQHGTAQTQQMNIAPANPNRGVVTSSLETVRGLPQTSPMEQWVIGNA